ncbi:GGDEF domain-containing protein [Nocardioides panacisoli]|uniref:GGDEF domain-containing protein n=1 Tax=Nocardioides panacisoli TaxID=627624 RepID=UPI001C625EE5|nr:GGDEF domain-containing protein [Nocardioides panacisoli]QYJ04536.1 GGDEF domain-containing protein [Nocardioides panacisoli]
METLDVFSLRVALGAVALTALVLMYAAVFRANRSAYCAWWCWALAAFMAGTACYLLNGTDHQVWANPLGNALTVGGAWCVWLAARSLRRPVTNAWWAVVPMGATGAAGLLDDSDVDVWAGGAVLLAAMALLLGLASLELLALVRASRTFATHVVYTRFARVMGITSTGLAAYYAWRLALFALVGPEHTLFVSGAGSVPTTIVTMVVLVVVSFSATALSNEEQTLSLRKRASLDPLTGLLNRADLELLSDREVQKARFTGTTAAVVLADLDRFKDINDTFGHQAGDQALRLFADSCRHSVRSSDVLGRYGGDEFVMVLPAADADTVTEVITSIRRLFTDGQSGRDGVVHSASFGVAYSDAETDFPTLLAHADAAMYRAKASGRGGVAVHEGP